MAIGSYRFLKPVAIEVTHLVSAMGHPIQVTSGTLYFALAES